MAAGERSSSLRRSAANSAQRFEEDFARRESAQVDYCRYTRDFAIPATLARTGKLRIVFRAHSGSVAGGLYGVRLLC
jgi:hypothetical protein